MADVTKFICSDLHLSLALNLLLKRTNQGSEAAYQRMILHSGLLLEVALQIGSCKEANPKENPRAKSKRKRVAFKYIVHDDKESLLDIL